MDQPRQRPPHRVVSDKVLARLKAQRGSRERLKAAADPQLPMPLMVKPLPGALMLGLFR